MRCTTASSPTRLSCRPEAASSRTTDFPFHPNAPKCCLWITSSTTSHPTAVRASSCLKASSSSPQNAHKFLRKKLVEENYLYAVVSLPAGVFQPYSGVKTSILLIDRALARNSKEILFVKVENDGFDLGAKRNPIEKNDLPEAIEIINQIKHFLIGNNENKPIKRDSRFLLVEKEKIKKDGEFTISFDRYRASVEYSITKWPLICVADLCEKILSGGTPSTKNEKYWKGSIPWISSADIVDLKTAKPRRFLTDDAIKNFCNKPDTEKQYYRCYKGWPWQTVS